MGPLNIIHHSTQFVISLIFFVAVTCSVGGSGSAWAEDALDIHNSGNDLTPIQTRSSPGPDREPGKATPQPPIGEPQYVPPLQRTVSFNFGLGLVYADLWPDNSTIGWDVLAGFEKAASNGWDFGAQVHVLNGSLSDTRLHTVALYATARPGNKWLQWLQLKAGIVDADYSDTSLVLVQQPPNYYYTNQTTTWSGRGKALGVGIIVGEGNFQWHVLDIERYFVAGHSFNVYSITIAVLGHFH